MVLRRRYYLNGQDAYRLKLLLPLTPEMEAARLARTDSAMEEAADGMPPLAGAAELAVQGTALASA